MPATPFRVVGSSGQGYSTSSESPPQDMDFTSPQPALQDMAQQGSMSTVPTSSGQQALQVQQTSSSQPVTQGDRPPASVSQQNLYLRDERQANAQYNTHVDARQFEQSTSNIDARHQQAVFQIQQQMISLEQLEAMIASLVEARVQLVAQEAQTRTGRIVAEGQEALRNQEIAHQTQLHQASNVYQHHVEQSEHEISRLRKEIEDLKSEASRLQQSPNAFASRLDLASELGGRAPSVASAKPYRDHVLF